MAGPFILFINRKQTPNVGDLSSTPFWYCTFKGAKCIHVDISKVGESSLVESKLVGADLIIVGGGGLLFEKYRKAITHLADHYSSKVVIWGVGLNTPGSTMSRELISLAKSFSLAGVRDLMPSDNHEKSDVMHHVPCITCLSQDLLAGLLLMSSSRILRGERYRVLLASNDSGSQNCILKNRSRMLSNHFPLVDVVSAGNKKTSLSSCIESIVSSDVIVTTSYHYSYWALLLGKPVISIGASYKFHSLHVISSYYPELIYYHVDKDLILESVSQVMEAAKRQLTESLYNLPQKHRFYADCINKNLSFARLVSEVHPAFRSIPLLSANLFGSLANGIDHSNNMSEV